MTGTGCAPCVDNQQTDKTHETRHSILGNKGRWSLMGNKEGEPYLERVSRPCYRKGNPGRERWTPWIEGAENLEENKTARVLRTGYQGGDVVFLLVGEKVRASWFVRHIFCLTFLCVSPSLLIVILSAHLGSVTLSKLLTTFPPRGPVLWYTWGPRSEVTGEQAYADLGLWLSYGLRVGCLGFCGFTLYWLINLKHKSRN